MDTKKANFYSIFEDNSNLFKKKYIIMKSVTLIFGAIYGLISIILGAFGAHALKKVISLDKLQSFETGVRYQMYGAFFLLIVGYILKFETPAEKWMSIFMIAGIFLFSVSIYLLAFSEVAAIPFKVIGPITPLGGLFMIISWAMLLFYFIKHK